MDLLWIAAAAAIASAVCWSRAEEPDPEEPPEYVPWEDEQPDDYDEEND